MTVIEAIQQAAGLNERLAERSKQMEMMSSKTGYITSDIVSVFAETARICAEMNIFVLEMIAKKGMDDH